MPLKGTPSLVDWWVTFDEKRVSVWLLLGKITAKAEYLDSVY